MSAPESSRLSQGVTMAAQRTKDYSETRISSITKSPEGLSQARALSMRETPKSNTEVKKSQAFIYNNSVREKTAEEKQFGQEGISRLGSVLGERGRTTARHSVAH